MRRHVLLVGLPGCGKSTVGRLVAEALGAPLLDIDSILVRQMGMPVEQIFGMVGEARFRAMERDAVATARAREPAVIVPGAGWAAQPGQLEAARANSLIIYLRCGAATAARRATSPSSTTSRTPGRSRRVRTLLAEREPFYRLADYEVAVETAPAAKVTQDVVRLAREHGGWG